MEPQSDSSPELVSGLRYSWEIGSGGNVLVEKGLSV